MHEYFTSYIKPSYSQCIDCNKRTTHICIQCHYCYSCHYKIEGMEKQRENVSKRYHRSFDRRILAQKYPVTFVSYEKKTDERGK
jgi:hypothetical protein